MALKKVQRKAAKMRVALAGTSGAGKTLSALYFAYGVTGDWEKIALIDSFPLNVTMRTKMAYAMEQNERGKTVHVKIGLAPVQRENTEYEFDLVLNIARNHIAIVSQDTTFLDNWNGIITPELGSSLRDWLSNGIEPSRCADCKLVITSNAKKTDDEIEQGTLKNYGRMLCWNCMLKEIKKRKEQAENETTPPVSD